MTLFWSRVSFHCLLVKTYRSGHVLGFCPSFRSPYILSSVNADGHPKNSAWYVLTKATTTSDPCKPQVAMQNQGATCKAYFAILLAYLAILASTFVLENLSYLQPGEHHMHPLKQQVDCRSNHRQNHEFMQQKELRTSSFMSCWSAESPPSHRSSVDQLIRSRVSFQPKRLPKKVKISNFQLNPSQFNSRTNVPMSNIRHQRDVFPGLHSLNRSLFSTQIRLYNWFIFQRENIAVWEQLTKASAEWCEAFCSFVFTPLQRSDGCRCKICTNKNAFIIYRWVPVNSKRQCQVSKKRISMKKSIGDRSATFMELWFIREFRLSTFGQKIRDPQEIQSVWWHWVGRGQHGLVHCCVFSWRTLISHEPWVVMEGGGLVSRNRQDSVLNHKPPNVTESQRKSPGPRLEVLLWMSRMVVFFSSWFLWIVQFCKNTSKWKTTNSEASLFSAWCDLQNLVCFCLQILLII